MDEQGRAVARPSPTAGKALPPEAWVRQAT